jgi:transcriptional regulator with XRE-family HTH domain
MKQPELGKKIIELRKAKGLTQEELVEKCNISVRTIQRIETGEVTPRSYTIKTILTALDYDLDKISEQGTENANPISTSLRNFLLLDIDVNRPSDFLITQLNLAWIFGIAYFILGFIDGTAEHFRFKENEMIFGSTAYVVIKILVLISFIFFQRGFIMIGGLFRNYLLKIISMILIGATVLITGYDIVSIFYDSIEREFVMFGTALSFGGIGIIYGIALRRLDKSLGRAAELAGVFEFIAACFFLSVVLSFIGFIVQIPAELLEIIIIFKAIEVIKSKAVPHDEHS